MPAALATLEHQWLVLAYHYYYLSDGELLFWFIVVERLCGCFFPF